MDVSGISACAPASVVDPVTVEKCVYVSMCVCACVYVCETPNIAIKLILVTT